MQLAFKASLSLLVVLAGVPHSFCACGCCDPVKASAPNRAAGACPHCAHRVDGPVPSSPPSQCECGDCHQIRALPTPPGRSLDVGRPEWRAHVEAHAPTLQRAAPGAPGSAGGRDSPRQPPGPGVSISLLLGRFLL